MTRTGGTPSSGASASDRALEQKPRHEDAAIVLPARRGEPDSENLPRTVPLVRRRSDVTPLVTLQPDEVFAERDRQHLGDLGIAGRLAIKKRQSPELLERFRFVFALAWG